MSKEMSPEQISSLFSTLEANPKLQAQWRALLAIREENSEQPAPEDQRRQEDSAPAPGKGPRTDDDKKEKQIESQPPADFSSAADFLSTMHDYALIRRVKQKNNIFVASAIRMMHTLYELDRILIRKFKARRAAMMMFPPKHVEYYAILWSLQVARCLQYAGYLDSVDDETFLSTFFDTYPPETLPIAGPLLPFFKAVTTFRHENALFKRVSPDVPENSSNVTTNGYQVKMNFSNAIFPNVPMIVDMTGRMIELLENADPKKINDALKAPFPLKYKEDSTTEFSEAPIIGGNKFSAKPAEWDNEEAAAFTTPGLLFRPPLNTDVLSNSQSYLDDLKNPNFSKEEYACSTLQKWLRMEKKTWFANLLAPMSEHAALTIGAGTLADCSVDGPSAGLYSYKYSDSETAPTKPVRPFDPKSKFDLSGTVTTSVSTPAPVDERLGAFSQVSAALATNHWYAGRHAAGRQRDGNVWDIKPEYGPSVEITAAATVATALERFIDPRIAK